MIAGIVTAELEAIVPVALLDAVGEPRPIEAVVDTGFSGFLTLPPAMVSALGLSWVGRQPGILADGREESFDVYRAILLWDSQSRTVEVEAAEMTPLVGMALLQGHEMKMQVLPGGVVSILALS